MATPSQDEVVAGGGLPEPRRVRMLDEEPLKSFWEFATTVRRTQSLAERESRKIRGAWLSPSLAIQSVHGWGLRSVRLICVNASSEEQCQRLRAFFQRDKRNLEGRLVHTKDPLDREPRVLVKIPYDSGLDMWVKHERRVLHELSGIKGVPTMGEQLYFEDIDVHAASYELIDAPNMQQHLEKGKILPQEETHSILSHIFATLKEAHALGWLHTDLNAKDVLLPPKVDANSTCSGRGLICGWSRAVHCSEAIDPGSSLVEFARSLTPKASAQTDSTSMETNDIRATIHSGEQDTDEVDAESNRIFSVPSAPAAQGRDAASPSIYAAPEQFLGLFAGAPCVSAATDVYRAAAIALMATCGNAPLGVQGKPVSRATVPIIDALRRQCKHAILRRAECGGKELLPTLEEVSNFAGSINDLLCGSASLRGCEAPELRTWFEHALVREMSARIQTVTEAIDELDSVWSEYEVRLAREYREKTERERTPIVKEEEKRTRLFFEPPPELAEMEVL